MQRSKSKFKSWERPSSYGFWWSAHLLYGERLDERLFGGHDAPVAEPLARAGHVHLEQPAPPVEVHVLRLRAYAIECTINSLHSPDADTL